MKQNIHMMRNRLMTGLIAVLASFTYATKADAQQWAVSTNALYWCAVTPNLGVEYAFNPKMSVAATVQYNPFTFGNNRKLKHVMGNLEYRYWLSEAFKGHYFGLNGVAGEFNFGNLPIGALKDYRFEGNIYGGGLSYGYQWIVSNRVNIGAEIGLGYWAMDYDKFFCQTCGERIDHYKSNYFGPTKIGINIIYLLK